MTAELPKDAIVASVKRQASKATKSLAAEDRADLLRFIESFFKPASTHDLEEVDPKALFDQAHSMWQLASSRRAGGRIVRVFNTDPDAGGWHTPHTIVQIISADMPFIVDSITGGLTISRRLGIHMIHHPLVTVDRAGSGKRRRTASPDEAGEMEEAGAKRESYIYIEIDAQSGAGALREIRQQMIAIMKDVEVAVEDWRPITGRVEEAIASITSCPPPVDQETCDETREFLRWLLDDNFTFIGFREYRFAGDPRTADFRPVPGSGLGILRDPRRHILRGPKGFAAISPEIREFLTQPDPIIVTKANVKTRVHRPVHLDYIGVKIFDKKNRIIGERRFVGLFTSQSYGRRALDIPYLRRKVKNVQKQAGFELSGHAGKVLTHILETFPRDELFQISEEQLLETGLGIQHLMERPRPRAFVRRDKFERFVSALVYVPRDKYQSGLRKAIEKILCDAFNGEISVYYAALTENVLARWHFIIRTKPGEVPDPDADEIDHLIEEAAKDWSEHLNEALIKRFGEETGNQLHQEYSGVFSAAYREAFEPHQATHDVQRLREMDEAHKIGFDAYRLLLDPDNVLRLKIYTETQLAPLSECLPKLEHLGLRVVGEHAYELNREKGGGVQDFYLENAYPGPIDVELVKPLVEDVLARIWDGRIEDDGLNALTIQANFSWSEVVVLRAYGKYLRQIGLPFSQEYVENCIASNADISRMLVDGFKMRFDPDGPSLAKRGREGKKLVRNIREALDRVESLDQDRILRNYLSAILATVRTNFFKQEFFDDRPVEEGGIALALKIRSRKIAEAPKPRPFAEIFVYSPRVEGVHLRSGPIARGGLRWSDRPEDFRTEILGLVKAQQVKNAVIIPVGAKGGFVPKKMPAGADRETTLREGIACYKIFVSTLLSITDNLKSGRVKHPDQVFRWDGDDPYLVVAADKGTATFSDIANGLAMERDFWLGDAFASGGSVGYDHKKMGITARGAWVSVQRHFREMGIDVQRQPITVIGIGDMSGDVFGNGMLLSKTIRLQVAFDHRHIFFDLDPDPAVSFKERRRLFRKARSSWADYNPALISTGGGVFERSAKAITLTRQMKEFLGVDARQLSPADLIHAILKAKADLLWVGGIGTYVKAASESSTEVGDRANDTLRINGAELGVKVVGEGGNLGLTQKGRIEFARGGGKVNTDFIDNSAGVGCSDKEVNIKILLADAISSGTLLPKDRPALLAQMTGEVAKIVLQDNYLQTQAMSIAEAQAVKEREQHAGLIRALEREGRLDREIENLPSEEDFSELALNQKGLTRPEIATLLAYAKMALDATLIESDILDNPAFSRELEHIFPAILPRRYPKQLNRHQLRREIVATTLANEVINRGGMTFVFDVKEETGLAEDQIVSAFSVVRDSFALNDIWPAIDALDYKVNAPIQTLMHLEVSEFLKHQTIWILRNMPKPLDVAGLTALFSSGLEVLLSAPERVLSPLEMAAFEEKCGMYEEHGVPRALGRRLSSLEAMGAACDIVHVAEALRRKVEDVGTAYFEVGDRVGFNWLRQTTEMVPSEDHWDHLAAHAIIDDLADQQRELTRMILTGAPGGKGLSAVSRWTADHQETLERADSLLSDLKSSGVINIAKLSFAVRHMRSILP